MKIAEHKDKKYVNGALAELRRQLPLAQTDSKRTKITNRIKFWEERIEKGLVK